MSMSNQKSVGDSKKGEKGDKNPKPSRTLQKVPPLSESTLNFTVLHSLHSSYKSGKGIKIKYIHQQPHPKL